MSKTSQPATRKAAPKRKAASEVETPEILPQEVGADALKHEDQELPVGQRNEMAEGLGLEVAAVAEEKPRQKRKKHSQTVAKETLNGDNGSPVQVEETKSKKSGAVDKVKHVADILLEQLTSFWTMHNNLSKRLGVFS